jgi:GT2 family glycosyltransferase
MKPYLSIIIVNYQSSEVLANCLLSLEGCKIDYSHEVIIYDNGPEDRGLGEISNKYSNIRIIIAQRQVSFSEANNSAVRQSSGEMLLFLNPDTILNSTAINALINFSSSKPFCGAAGPRLINERGVQEMSYGKDPAIISEALSSLLHKFPTIAHKFSGKEAKAKPVDWITAAVILIKREAFEAVGGFDEKYPLYFEDSDLCRRIRMQGWAIFYLQYVSVIHLKGKSEKIDGATPNINNSRILKYRASQARYYHKHHGWFQNIILKAYLKIRMGKLFDQLKTHLWNLQ